MASDKKLIKYYGKIADQIIKLEPNYANLKDEDFKELTAEFKQRIANGEELDDILIEAYAVAREAAYRTLGLKAYRVQLIGAIILNVGDIAKMRTGEGKTLTGLFPAYLNALSGKGVHIITVNEYLSRRDSEINGQVYDLLGITVGLNSSEIPKGAKRQAYLKDITYTTNSELGFDYLKDNMVMDFSQKVQRGLNYAIIDEADSILIDESRTPLIISGGTSSRVNLYKHADAFAQTLKSPEDVDIDLESKQVYLNEEGMKKAKEYFTLENLFALENTEIFHLIMNALKAHFTFKEGVEYTVHDNEIVLIDQFTGRIMDGRSYSDGLQQALQAKEGVEIEEETVTMATITYQNFYRLYAKLAGMTGTAKTEEEEFIKIYNTRVVVTPTNRPVIRKDEPDYTFGTKNAALKKLIADAKIIHEKGNPILIGTTSVESSEQIARYLEKAKLKFEMINAKNHHREADIIAMAGQKGAITLATNMAGRGTDIKLSQEVRELGGLIVFGVERNEARRIDNQLRGRSGRQGDPGMSRYYISMDDELMIRFSSPKMRANFAKLGDDHIKSRFFTRAVTNAQKKLEGMNFDQRKNVLDYDNILAQQREAMYAQRDDILQAESLKVVLKKFQITVAYNLIESFNVMVHGERTIDAKKLLKAIDGVLVAHNKFKEKDFFNREKIKLAEKIAEAMMEFYTIRISDVPEDVINDMEKRTILESFDHYWTKHIDLSSKLKSGIYLQQYAQNNPLAEYVEQATTLFNRMKINIASDVINKLANVVLKAVDSEEKPQPIEITDNDIEIIFAETGLDKTMVNNEAINRRFDELEAENQGNSKVLHKLKIQRDIMLGLVIEIEKRFANNQPPKLEVGIEAIESMLRIFGITNPEDAKIELIEERYQQLLKEVENEEEKQEQLKIAKEVLKDFVSQINLFKVAETKKADEDDDGLTKLTKTRMG